MGGGGSPGAEAGGGLERGVAHVRVADRVVVVEVLVDHRALRTRHCDDVSPQRCPYTAMSVNSDTRHTADRALCREVGHRKNKGTLGNWCLVLNLSKVDINGSDLPFSGDQLLCTSLFLRTNGVSSVAARHLVWAQQSSAARLALRSSSRAFRPGFRTNTPVKKSPSIRTVGFKGFVTPFFSHD